MAPETLRVVAGGVFLVWFGAVVWMGWKLTRPWQPEGRTQWGEVDPDTVRAIEARRNHR